jgi:hypothetical protein
MCIDERIILTSITEGCTSDQPSVDILLQLQMITGFECGTVS